jgi:serine/threonine protein phosphatase PrpC
VCGPAHARAGELNQDAWYARTSQTGTLAVVADGMGSRPAGRLGARAAVAASRDAFRLWSASPSGSGEDLVRLIEVLWRLRLQGTPIGDAATTCLVCALRADGTGVAVQLGDGVLGICATPSAFRAVAPEREGFASTTVALGTPHGLQDWSIASMEPLSPGAAVLLATDGVADDLVPGRRAPFVAWLVHELGSAAAPQRALRRALTRWPVPRHLDDKTLVVLWEPAR